LAARKKVGYSERDLSDGLIRFEGRHPWGIGVTAMVIASEGEAAVYDTLMFPSEGRRMARSIRDRGLRVKILINSHWHIDHIGGNQFFPGRRLAHRLCPNLMKADAPGRKWAKKTWPREFHDYVLTLPNETLARRATVQVGKEKLIAFPTPGHTPDSISVLVKGARATLTADAAMELPLIGTGDSGEYLRSLRTISRTPAAIIVQGHGKVVPRSKVRLDIAYLERCRATVREAARSGASSATVLPLPLAQFIGEKRAKEFSPVWKEIHSHNLSRISEEFGLSK